MRKKVLIGVGAFIAVLVAAALIVPHLIDINHYHDQIQAQLQSKLGRKVSLGKMSFSLFPPSFSVEHAVIGEDPGFNTGQPFATADKLSVDVEFWPLFAKQVEINSLRMEQPHIELVKNVQGVWNFSTLGQTGKSKAGQKTPAAPSKDKKDEATPGLSPPNVEIIDGQVAITDVEKHPARAVYDHIDLKLSDFEEDSHFSLKATAHLPGEGRQAIYLEGKGGPLQPSAFIKTNFEGKLKLEQVSVSGV